MRLHLDDPQWDPVEAMPIAVARALIRSALERMDRHWGLKTARDIERAIEALIRDAVAVDRARPR